MKRKNSFSILAECGNARLGILRTNHGNVETPFFMPVATKATGKFISSDDYASMKAGAIISNAFLLSLKPGLDTIKKSKGIHNFMHYKGVVFTDCGGFQMLKPSLLLKHDHKDGVYFKDPFHNKTIFIGPKKIMDIEKTIGADIIMALDNVAPYGNKKSDFKLAMDLTHKWQRECKEYYKGNQLIFGIAQGGTFPDLRKKSSEYINSLDFDGNAIGGLCIGEPKEKMLEMVGISSGILDKDKPRYLMGVGSPDDILRAVSLGVDIFDSIYPTRNARHGTIFTWKGRLYVDRIKYAKDTKPMDEDCDCFVCRDYSKSYLHHLFKIREPIVKRYLSYHNLYFMQRFMDKVRKEIKNGTFSSFKRKYIRLYKRRKSD